MSGNAATQFTGSGGFHDLTSLSIFAPETITPGQFFASMGAKDTHTPEKRFVLEILMDAIRCALGTPIWINSACSTSRKGRLRDEALRWIAGGDAAFTFDFVCELLSINPEWLRQGIRALPAGTKIDRRSPPIDGHEKIGSNYVRRRH